MEQEEDGISETEWWKGKEEIAEEAERLRRTEGKGE